jgi:hypothetical protein
MVEFVVVAAFIAIALGVVAGGFLWISLVIAKEDRRRGSLLSVAPSASAQAARSLVGIRNSGLG